MQKNIYELGVKQRIIKSVKKAVSLVTGLSVMLTMTTSSMATIEARAEGTVAVEAETIEWTDGTYEVQEDVSFGERISVSGNVTLILNDGKTLIAEKGITVGEGSSLTISGGAENTGVLYAGTTDGSDCSTVSGNAGIGGLSGESCGTVIINGGAVMAYGDEGAMGIGKGFDEEGILDNGTLTLGTNVTLSTSTDKETWTPQEGSAGRERYMKTVYTPPVPTYTVTLTGGANATPSGGSTTQSGLTGAMTTVVYTATTGYHFEAFSDITNNGITATRTSDTVVTVSGTPTADASLTIPDAVLPHSHSWTYSASGAVITATCVGCPDSYSGGVALTLSASNATYNGSTHGATLDSAAWTTAGIAIPTIYYEGANTTVYESSTTAPSDAGTYTASVTVDTDKTATVGFTISPATLTGVSVTQVGTLTYDGTAQTPTVNAVATAVNSQAVTFTYCKYISGTYGEMPSFTDVSECGVIYYKASAPNHQEISGNFTITMNKADREAPAAPTLDSSTVSSITLNTITNGLYKCGNGQWQESPTFTELDMNTEYEFYQCIAEDGNYNQSASSAVARFSTNDHVHDYSYAATGATITQSCDNTDGGHGEEAAATITIVAPTLNTYGGEGDATATITGSLNGVANPTIVYKSGSTVLDAAPTDAGTYTASITLTGVTLTGGETGDVTASVSYTIAQKAVTITATAQSITYGDSISGGEAFVTATGLLEGHEVSAVTLTPSTEFVTNGGTIAPSAATIMNGSINVTANYYISYETGTLTIGERNITITASDQSVGLNGTISSDVSQVSYASDSFAPGDAIYEITLTSSSTAAATTNGTITATDAVIKRGGPNGDNVTANYHINYVEGTLTVAQAIPAITHPTARTLSYTGSAQVLINAGSTSAGTLKYSLNGTDYTGDVSQITGTNAGNYTVYYMVEGDENCESTAPATLIAIIGQMAAPASVEDNQKPTAIPNLRYTGSAQSLLTAASELPTGYVRAEYAFEGETTFSETIPTASAVDNYAIQVKYIGDGNHESFVLSETIAAAIAARDLSDGVTISVSPISFTVGDANVTPTVTVTITASSTVLEEGTDYDLEYVGVSPTTYPQSATAPTSHGTYKAVVVFKGNYTGTATSATSYTIERASEAPTANDDTTIYDGTTYDLSNLFSFPVAEVGKTYSIVSEGTTGDGSISGNMLTITKAGIIKIKVVTTATETVAAGEAISTLTVNKGTATGSISVADITYGAILADATITCTPTEAGHLDVEYCTDGDTHWSTTKPTSAGSYHARVTLGGNDLYEAVVVSCDFEIAKKALTVTADNKTKVRDTADPALTYEVTSGLVEGETAAAVLGGALTRETGETVGTYAITVGTLAVVGGNYDMTFVPGTFTITKAIHSEVTVGEANAPLVPTVSLTGLTLDVKNFITPAPAESTTYTVTAATGVVVASPLPTVSGSTVTYSVSSSSDNDPGSITVTVNDPNYEAYEVTIPIKASTSANFKTETDFTNTGVADNTVSAVTVTGLENYARTQASDGTAVEIVFDVDKTAADSVSEAIKANALSAARGNFTSLGYTDSDLKRAYLTIDVKKYSATDFASLNTSGAYDSVTDIVTPVEIAINVGTDVTAKRPVVVRDHGGTSTLLTEIGARATGSYQDGKYYVDKSAGIIYVYTRYFSVYSLVYAGSVPVTVTFDSAGGTAVSSVTIKSGRTVAKPTDPTRSGYKFNGWLIGGAEYNFYTAVTANITLTARWTLVTTGSTTSGGAGNSTTGSTTKSTTTTKKTTTYKSSTSKSTYKSSTSTYSTYSSADDEDDEDDYVSVTSTYSPIQVASVEPEETEEEKAMDELFEEPVEEIMPVHEETAAVKTRSRTDILFLGAVILGILMAGAVIGWIMYEIKQTLRELEMKSRKSRAV